MSQAQVVQPETFFLTPTSKVPNSRLPALVYRSALTPASPPTELSADVVCSRIEPNGWIKGGIFNHFPTCHFHSVTHEAYGVLKGSSKLRLGRAPSELEEHDDVIVPVSAGDVIVIPAGVSHYWLESSDEPPYEYVGLYPEGSPHWDMNLCKASEEETAEKAAVASSVPIPTHDPVYGKEGPLTHNLTFTDEMVYLWDDKQDICYEMYVRQKRSLEEVMEWMRDHRDFTPSKRAYQTQFKRWDFPSKQHPAHKNEALVDRVKELWEQNATQAEMLDALHAEGFRIKERELMRLRARKRWLLRVPNNTKRKLSLDDLEVDGDVEAIESDRIEEQNGSNLEPSAQPEEDEIPALDPQVEAQRLERRREIEAESSERYASRKRRRRTRGWGGMPADPPAPPRFPSETTLDESKVTLHLSNDEYRSVRLKFQQICEEEGISKKTLAGPEVWQAAKVRLINENNHLRSVFDDPSDSDRKYLSLDVVCIDVTKRMRTAEHKMTLADAKNMISVNPDESRKMRDAFYKILQADHFTSKLDTGVEHWDELKEKWINESDIVQRVLSVGESDPQYPQRLKALETICRDVMKRLRDDQNRRDPSKRKSNTTKGSTGSIPPVGTGPSDVTERGNDGSILLPPGNPRPVAEVLPPDLQIDPSLLLAASDPSVTADLQTIQPSRNESLPFSGNLQFAANPFLPHTGPFPVYFRLNPRSQVHNIGQPTRQLWLGTLISGSIRELEHLAVKDLPQTRVIQFEGIAPDVNGNEVSYIFDSDEELGAYLAHVAGRKAIFSVTLDPITSI
ncbi:MAG: hypothetical protein M1820_005678 [Bogoriella megaspora]|nr:MAG: hypothetical protein M1820_005678 [Bogoriella megaspora]